MTCPGPGGVSKLHGRTAVEAALDHAMDYCLAHPDWMDADSVAPPLSSDIHGEQVLKGSLWSLHGVHIGHGLQAVNGRA